MKILSLTQTLSANGQASAINVTLQDAAGESHSYSVSTEHPAWNDVNALVGSLQDGAITAPEFGAIVKDKVDLAEKAMNKIHRISGVLGGALTMKNRRIYVDHEPVDPVLESHILSLLAEDGSPKDVLNWTAFAKFVDKLYSNASKHVRDQFFGWLRYEAQSHGGFTLTDDGDVIGYKGCMGTLDKPLSVMSGPAIVDGEAMNGNVPNVPGSLIEIERSKVVDDPAVACASGLHVGTYDYAKGWSRGVLLKVQFSPRDIVSVPTDCNAQKIRVARYRVIEAIQGPVQERTVQSYAQRQYDNPALVSALEAAAQAGESVAFSYNGKDRLGVVKEISVGGSGRYIKLEESQGEVKSFTVRKISNLLTGTAVAAKALEGKRVTFVYNGKRRAGVLKEVATGAHGAYLVLKGDGNDRGLKSFTVAKMSDFRELAAEGVFSTSDGEASADTDGGFTTGELGAIALGAAVAGAAALSQSKLGKAILDQLRDKDS